MRNRIFTTMLAMGLSLALIVAGCSTSWINTALNDLPVVVQIVTSILSIADVAAIPQAKAAGAEANTDLQNLQKFLADYKSAKDAAAQQTALGNVQAALQATNGDLASILAAVHVKDPAKQAAISAGVGVALSVIVSVQSLLPSNSNVPKVARAVKLQSAKEVRKSYNSAVAAAYPSAVLH